MSQVDKIKIDESTYDIAASANATNKFVSDDTTTSESKAWTEVDTMATGEANKSIFNKISTMFKNIRFLYNSLGTGVTPSSTVTTQLSEKAPTSHNHTTAQLPVSSSQINSNTSIPTSALIYSMDQKLTNLSNSFNETETWTGGNF